MLGAGLKPQFVGTAEAEPKKLEQVRAMLARKASLEKVEELLSGSVPHQVEFENHKSFYENLEFGVGEVYKMVTNQTLKVYAPCVANLPKERLLLNGK
jgi:hypothetical protein